MSEYRNFHSSILKFCKDFATENSLVLIDFEGHANIHELPDQDLVGPIEYELMNDEGLYTITGMIGISTFNDTNLSKLRSAVDKLFDRLSPGCTLPWYYADTASVGGVLKVTSPVMVSSVSKQAQSRPLQYVAFSMVTNVAGR